MQVARALLGTLLASAMPAFAQSFSSVTLGAAGDLTVFNMGPTVFSASNSGTYFEGNAGLGAGASTNFSGGGTLSGVLYKDPGATVQSNIASQFHVNGGVQTSSMAQAVMDANNASSAASSLAATQTFNGSISNGYTFSSTGQYNVLDINGNISVTNSSKNVILSGSSNDWFIVNVNGDIAVSNGSIGLTGGLTANHVLFNVIGTGHDVSLSNASSSLYGTYLDVNGTINLTPGSVYGAVLANNIHTSSGPNVYANLYAVAPVPEPETYAMLLAGLGLIGFTAKRRRLFYWSRLSDSTPSWSNRFDVESWRVNSPPLRAVKFMPTKNLP